jgi:1,4-dihydroxy-2-naphthoyl-CoA hydrolase
MTVEEINRLCRGTLIEHLNIEFTGYSERQVEALMRITPAHFQPAGTVHGGALIALAESVGSAGSFLLVDPEKYQVFGAVVNSQHLSPAREGTLHAVATLVARMEFKHVWDVEIRDDAGELISISRVTNSVKPKQEGAD